MKKILASTLSSAALIASMLGGSAAAAGSATLSMTSKSVVAGNNVAVTISQNSGTDTVNVVQADFSYDTSKLQFVGVSCGGGFESTAAASANGVTCYTMAPKSGAQSVATATFKALANSGTAAISFAGTSHIYRSTDSADIWNGSTAGATISFSAPAVAAPAPVKAVPKTTTTRTATAAAPVAVATTESQKVAPVVASANEVKNYNVTVKVVDKRGDVVAGAEVTLSGITAKTNNEGMVSFTKIPGGKYEVKISSKKVSDTIAKVNIAKDDQKMLATIPAIKKSKRWFFFGTIATITAIGAAVYAGRNKLKQTVAKISVKVRSTGPKASVKSVALTAAPLKTVSKKPSTKKVTKKTVKSKKVNKK